MHKDILYSDFLSVSFSYDLSEVDSEKKAHAHCTGYRHMPFTIVIYCHDVEYVFESLDGVRKVVKPTETIVIPADTVHKMTTQTPLLHSFIHVRYMLFEALDILSLYDVPYIIRGERSQRIQKLIDKISHAIPNAVRNEFPFSTLLIQREAVYALLNEIIAISTIKESSPSLLLGVAKIHKVLGYIQKNYGKITGRSELAKVMNLSETRFHYIFKDVLGVAPMQYLNDLRMKKARVLLISSDAPINIIAKEVGYGDVFSFSRQFKKCVGMSPTDYRRSNILFGSF